MTVQLHSRYEASSLQEVWAAAWPWLVLALGIVVVVVGGVFFSPA